MHLSHPHILIASTLLFLACCLHSCNKSKSNSETALLEAIANAVNDDTADNDKHQNDTLWNKSIRNEFYGSRFGQSSEMVMGNFYDIDQSLQPTYATDTNIVWEKSPGDEFRFANYSWSTLVNEFRDDQLAAVRFFNDYDEKQEAITQFNSILKDMSKGYKMTKVEPGMQNVLKKYVAFSRQKRIARLILMRYNNQDNNVVYRLELDYVDCNLWPELW